MTLYGTSFDNGTHGVSITAANSAASPEHAFNTFTKTNGATATFTNQNAVGPLAALLVTGGTAGSSYGIYTTRIGTLAAAYGWMFMHSAAAPSIDIQVVRARAASLTCFDIRYNTTGRVALRTAAGGTLVTSTNAIPLNQPVRLEWFIQGTATGSYTFRVFHDAFSSTPTETFSGTGNFRSSFDEYQTGIITAIANYSLTIDDVRWDSAQWPNVAPTITMPPDLVAARNATTTLTPTALDIGGDTLTRSWAFDSKPAHSALSLADVTTSSHDFTWDAAGRYVIRGTVTDPGGLSASDTTVVDVPPTTSVWNGTEWVQATMSAAS